MLYYLLLAVPSSFLVEILESPNLWFFIAVILLEPGRSIVVDEQFHRQGQGQAMVQYLLQFACEIELQKIIVLTYVPEYFNKLGFSVIDKSSLAENIIEDSEPSPHKDPADEVAMEYIVGQGK